MSDFPVESVEVSIVYKTPDGLTKVNHKVEASNTLKIARCIHDYDKQFKPKKDPDTGDLIGHEPTGVETLVLKVKLIRDP